ncbi:MAG: type I methionyl aminopeptidase [bacterium]|nr:type I methionyl aminopeptidase [bacterium]
MIKIKTPAEIEIMAEGGKILGEIRRKILEKVKSGTSTLELNETAEELISKSGGEPSFKTVKNYPYATCMCVNETVVHGFPDKRPLKNGDILGVDVGLLYKGFHTDTSWTIAVGEKTGKTRLFLKAGETALKNAIVAAVAGNRVGDISFAIEKTIIAAGCSPVRQLVGHGVGQKLHEDPEIPCFLKKPIGKTPLLREGMTLAIEIIYMAGRPEVIYRGDDDWTIVTGDGFPSALFEQTIAVTSNGPRILTLDGKFDRIKAAGP